MGESTLAKNLPARSFIIFLAFAAFPARANLYPNAEPTLGGKNWQRRLSPELRVGKEADHAAFGATLRFHWGPWLGIEGDFQRIFTSVEHPRDAFSALISARFAWSDENFVAPLIGFESAKWGSGTWSGVPVGVQFHGAFLGLGFWLEGLVSLTTKKDFISAYFQVDKSFRVSRSANAFVGIRVSEKSFRHEHENGVFFTSGSRF